MRILLLTFYYPPDLSAGSYRAAALAEALRRVGGSDVHVDVLTTEPNRYHSYRQSPESADDELSVRRLPVRVHRSGVWDQSLAFSGFAWAALRAVRGQHYDVVVATTSRLFTGFLGTQVAKLTGARLYLDVRDLFVDTIGDLFGSRSGVSLLRPLLSLVERVTIRRASRLSVASPGFADYLEHRYPAVAMDVFTNGIDEEFLDEDFSSPSSTVPIRILYAGNIGLGQGLETIVPEAARRLGEGYEFRIIGDGGRRRALQDALRGADLDNVAVVAPMDRAALKDEYRRADYLLVHLNDFAALDKVLPSKLFELAATGKPILAGVRGHARAFIEESIEGAAIFPPGDAAALAEAVAALPPGQWAREQFKREFVRTRIMDRMARDVLQTGL